MTRFGKIRNSCEFERIELRANVQSEDIKCVGARAECHQKEVGEQGSMI